MATTAQDIADWFLTSIDTDAGDSLTPLKLQKLVFYAQAWSLALRNKPLFRDDFEAWTHGPVIRSLWNKYKNRGWEAIEPPKHQPSFDKSTESLLKDVLNSYGNLSAKRLEHLTHSENPWIKARGDLPLEAASSAVIEKDVMRQFYSALYKKTKVVN